MKKLPLMLALLGLAAMLPAQDIVYSTLADASAPNSTEYTAEQLDQLTAPIALYPDALVAIILPAATAPDDVVAANNYLQANGDPAQISIQPWDESVQALCNYPEVVQWMAENLDWTEALGRAFIQQPKQVMESIQQMRAQARAEGMLTNTPEQNVVLDGSTILIEPVSPDYICVPQYDPSYLFITYPVTFASPPIFFGPRRHVGPWLRFECDWDDFGVWLGVWHPGWVYTRDWRPVQGAVAGGFWRADPVHQRTELHTLNRPVVVPPHPRSMPHAPAPAAAPQAARPAPAPGSSSRLSRPDPTGWRSENNGQIRVAPVPVQTRPRIFTTPPNNQPPPRPVPQIPSGAVSQIPSGAVSQIPPGAVSQIPSGAVSQIPSGATPLKLTPDMGAPQPTSPPVPFRPNANQPRPVPARPSEPMSQPSSGSPRPATPAPTPHSGAPAPAPRPATPGPAFGDYNRGTTVQEFSNRGQASRTAASPPPPAARPATAPAPAPRSAPEPQPSSGGNTSNQRYPH